MREMNMKQIIFVSPILLWMVISTPASAMPQGIPENSVLQLRTKDQPVQMAEFKKEQKRKKTAKRKKSSEEKEDSYKKNIDRSKEKINSGDGFINDDDRKSRDRDGFHQRRLKNYDASGPEIRYYHRKKRSSDAYKGEATYNKD